MSTATGTLLRKLFGLGVGTITMDPIFSGLAWALILGLLVSTAFTLVLGPMIYYMLYARRSAAASTAQSE